MKEVVIKNLKFRATSHVSVVKADMSSLVVMEGMFLKLSIENP